MNEEFNPFDEGVLKENQDKFIAFSEDNDILVDLYHMTLRRVKKNEMVTYTKFIQANGTHGSIGYQQVDFTFQKLFNEAPKFSKTIQGEKIIVRQKDQFLGLAEKKLIELPRISDLESDEYEVEIEEKEWLELIYAKKRYFLEIDTSMIFKKDEGE